MTTNPAPLRPPFFVRWWRRLTNLLALIVLDVFIILFFVIIILFFVIIVLIRIRRT